MNVFEKVDKRGRAQWVNRWAVRLRREEADRIDALKAAAGAESDAAFFRMLVNHWAETHPEANREGPPKSGGTR